MRTTQSVCSTSPDLTVMQGAYRWCCAAMDNIPVGKAQGITLWRCGLELEPQFTSPGMISFRPSSSLTNEILIGSANENWLRFQSLVQQWRQERGATSSITEMVMTPAYQKIVGMGYEVIPFILAQLRSEGDDPDQWFWALMALTGMNPVDPTDQGDYLKMSAGWLNWAEREGYAW